MNRNLYNYFSVLSIGLFFLFPFRQPFDAKNNQPPKDTKISNNIISEPFLCDGSFYLSISTESSTSLYTLEVGNTVSFNLVGSSPFDYNGITFRASDRYIYAKGPFSHELYRIGQGGIATYVGQLPGLSEDNWYIAADFSPEDYYVVTSNDGGDKIAVYDISNDTPSIVAINYKTYTDGHTGIGNFGDIAFHPHTGLCYGYDHNTLKLCLIDPLTGGITAFGNPQSPEIDAIGALFFNAKGELFAYGRDEFYQIDLTTGAFTLLTNGPHSSTLDGCSCPYNISFTKSVEVPKPCSSEPLRYTFEIINNSGTTQEGITFTDQLPENLLFSSDPIELLGGQISGGSVIDSDLLEIVNMSIPPGYSSFEVEVEIETELEDLVLNNQARLKGFDSFLPFEIRSDDPGTFQFDDQTTAIVSNNNIEPSASFSDSILSINYGDSILLEPIFNFPPDSFYWSGPNLETCATSCSELWASPTATSSYSIFAIDEYGCSASADIRVDVLFDKGLYIPNAFSPNGDGVNDLFTVYGKEENIRIESLQIFNRWGGLVFQASDFPPNSEVGWDGVFNGQLMNASVFVWLAEVSFPNGQVEIMKGDLTLLR